MVRSSSPLVLSVIKTEVLLDCDDPAYQKFSIATKWRTNCEAITTRQIEQILCGRRIC